MIANAQYDISNLSEKISGLSGALLGRGATPGDLQMMLKVEDGQLHAAMGKAVIPDSEKAMKRITRDIQKVLSPFPIYIDFEESQQDSNYQDFTWLYAGPNFIAGIRESDNLPDASPDAAYNIFREGQKSASRGLAWEDLGVRKKNPNQHVMRLNRVRVNVRAFQAVRSRIKKSLGEMAAAFYAVAKNYAPRIKVPAGIEGKIPRAIEKGKSHWNDNLASGGAQGFIETTIRSPGVESNPKIVQKIQGAINSRVGIVRAKLKKVLSGRIYEWETGRVFPPKQESEFYFSE